MRVMRERAVLRETRTVVGAVVQFLSAALMAALSQSRWRSRCGRHRRAHREVTSRRTRAHADDVPNEKDDDDEAMEEKRRRNRA